MDQRTCSVDDCEGPHRARGLCNRHYLQLRRTPDFQPRGLSECGTRAKYRRGCRCDECVEAMRASTRAPGGAPFVPQSARPHGTPAKYDRGGCRCDECRKANSAYRRKQKSPETVRRHNRAAKLKRKGATLTTAAKSYAELILGDPCVYCGTASRTLDHIVPIVGGGTSDWNNIAPACLSCNASKGARPLLAFLLRRLHSAQPAEVHPN